MVREHPDHVLRDRSRGGGDDDDDRQRWRGSGADHDTQHYISSKDEFRARIDRLLKRARKRDTREFGRNDTLGNAINYNTELSRDNSVGA